MTAHREAEKSIPEVKVGKEGAFKNAVEFFIKHL
jgi:hypothetical protein